MMQGQLQRAGNQLAEPRWSLLALAARHQADGEDLPGPIVHGDAERSVGDDATVEVLPVVDAHHREHTGIAVDASSAGVRSPERNTAGLPALRSVATTAKGTRRCSNVETPVSA